MKYLIRAAGLVVSAVCLVLIARVLRPSSLLAAWQHAQPLWLAPAAVTLALFLVLNALRWRTLLLPAAKVPAPRLLRWQLIGYLANTVFPFRAGEVARVLLVARGTPVRPAATVATIVVEKICDGTSLVALFVLGLLLLTVPDWVTWLARAGAAVFALGLVAILVLAAYRDLPLPARWLRWPLLARLRAILLSALAVVPGPAALAGLLGQSLLLWAVDALNTGCVLHAFGIGVSAPGVLLVTAGLNLAQIVPAGPAAIGSYELAIVALLGVLGVGSAPAQLAALGMRAIQYAPPAVAGLVALWLEGLSLGELQRAARERPRPRVRPQEAEG